MDIICFLQDRSNNKQDRKYQSHKTKYPDLSHNNPAEFGDVKFYKFLLS